MKKIIILAMMLTVGNADMCLYSLKSSNKHIQKATYMTNIDRKLTHMNMALQSMIDARYDCPPKMEDEIQVRIDNIESKIEELK